MADVKPIRPKAAAVRVLANFMMDYIKNFALGKASVNGYCKLRLLTVATVVRVLKFEVMMMLMMFLRMMIDSARKLSDTYTAQLNSALAFISTCTSDCLHRRRC